ncbi:DUF1772 domain-containing protein [Deinococcus marmoris]|uniref:DUF1772 domain-containing protein n=1 Tax=Deinococcus marmoris TaxID=249408 RepID=UPI000494EFBE|nr:DUF1772 domain-containing protein [Deinococcus marmoris]
MNLLWVVGTVLAGLNAGILVAGLLEGFYLRGVGLSAYLQMHQPRDALFRRMMPPLLLTLMVCCLGLVALTFGTGRAWLALIAFALVLADVLITVRLMVPLNVQLGSYDALKPLPEGEEVRRRWSTLHPLRTGLGGLAFVSLAMFSL